MPNIINMSLSFVRRLVGKILIFFVSIVDLFIPKKKNLIIFGSDSGRYANDNPRAIFNLMKRENPEFEIYYWTNDESIEEKHRLNNWSLKSIFKYLRAKTLIASHGVSDFFIWGRTARRKIFINTWHGMPAKATGVVSKNCPSKTLIAHRRNEKNLTAFLAPSRIFASSLSLWHTPNRAKFFYAGQPRNDILLKKEDRGQDRILELIGEDIQYSKVILYSPTWRSTIPPTPTKFFPFEDLNVSELERFLDEENAIILIRPHGSEKPFDSGIDPTQAREWGDPRFRAYHISPEVLSLTRVRLFDFNKCPEITPILKEVDVLITDYSGIYFDFLLLDRPIIFIPYDLEKYLNPDQLFYDYDTITPGPKIETFRQFLDSLISVFNGNDAYREFRKIINKMFNYHQTEDSTEKVRNHILYLLGMTDQKKVDSKQG